MSRIRGFVWVLFFFSVLCAFLYGGVVACYLGGGGVVEGRCEGFRVVDVCYVDDVLVVAEGVGGGRVLNFSGVDVSFLNETIK